MKAFINARMSLAALFTTGALALISLSALAQGGPGGPGGPGGFPPEVQAKFKALQKWREEHKNLSSLSTMLYQVEEVNKDSAYKLDKSQSAKMLTIINSWKSKDSMNEDQAKSVSKQISGLLTDKQIKKMTTVQPRFGGGRPGGGGPGGPRPGGFGGPGGPGGGKMDPKQFAKMIPDPPKKPYNPLNPDSFYIERVRPMMKKNMDDFTSSLQKQAKG
jgi:hypothetical protein